MNPEVGREDLAERAQISYALFLRLEGIDTLREAGQREGIQSVVGADVESAAGRWTDFADTR
jgi:hypothetical protein